MIKVDFDRKYGRVIKNGSIKSLILSVFFGTSRYLSIFLGIGFFFSVILSLFFLITVVVSLFLTIFPKSTTTILTFPINISVFFASFNNNILFLLQFHSSSVSPSLSFTLSSLTFVFGARFPKTVTISIPSILTIQRQST